MLTLQLPNSQLSLGGRAATADEWSKLYGPGRIQAQLRRVRENIVLSVSHDSSPLHQNRVSADGKSSIPKRNDPNYGYCD